MTRRRHTASPSLSMYTLNQKEHHRMPRALKFLALVVVVVAVAAGADLGARSLKASASGPSPATSSRTPAATTPATVTAKACVDATASSNREFADGVVKEIVDAVSSWDPPLPSGAPTTAEAAVPALSLWVRQVRTNSYSTQSASLDLQIPAVPALSAPPALSDPNLATDQLNWASRESTWWEDLKQARRRVSAAMAAVENYPLDDKAGNFSAISGCTAALVGEGTQNASTRMLLASDLQEDRPPVAANYGGASMLIDENCPWTAQLCTSSAARWTARFQRQGMGSVAVVRADAANQAIESWLLGGRS